MHNCCNIQLDQRKILGLIWRNCDLRSWHRRRKNWKDNGEPGDFQELCSTWNFDIDIMSNFSDWLIGIQPQIWIWFPFWLMGKSRHRKCYCKHSVFRDLFESRARITAQTWIKVDIWLPLNMYYRSILGALYHKPLGNQIHVKADSDPYLDDCRSVVVSTPIGHISGYDNANILHTFPRRFDCLHRFHINFAYALGLYVRKL